EHYFRVMRSQQQFQQRDRGEENAARDASGGQHSGAYANGRDDADEMDGGDFAPGHGSAQASASPLDVVDPEAAEQAPQPPQASGQDRDEGRSRRPRRQRRRYEGGGADGSGGE